MINYSAPKGGDSYFTFPFTPQTWVRTTQNAKQIFRMPEEILQLSSKRYKKRLIRYSEYKDTLRGYALSKHFDIQVSGTAVYFFLPIPKKWTKKRRAEAHMQEHHRKPDLSNLLKAFEDGLLPKRDESISGYAGLKKFWVDAPSGWIELHLNMPQYNPLTGIYEVMKSSSAISYNYPTMKQRDQEMWHPHGVKQQ